MRAVNLLPRDERGARLEAGRLPLIVAAGGVVLVTAASMFLASSASGSAKDAQTELAAVESEIARLPDDPDAAVSQGTIVRERAERVAALSAALTSRVSFDQVLHEISYVLPDDAWLTQLEATAPEDEAPVAEGAAPAPSPTTTTTAPLADVTIQGAAFDHDTVAVVLARLAVVPTLENVRLAATALVEPQASESQDASGQTTVRKGKPFVTFIVTASLRTVETR